MPLDSSKYVGLILWFSYVIHILSKDVKTITIHVDPDTTEVTLDCDTQSEVAWVRGDEVLIQGGQKVTTDPRIKLIIGTIKQLRIEDIRSNYSGKYSCLKYHRGEVTNKTIVLYEVMFIEHLSKSNDSNKLIFVEGTNAVLSCPIDGRPEPLIRWYMVAGDELHDIGIKGRKLIIRNFTRSCATRYMCIANNNYTASPINHTMEPIPHFAPEIESRTKHENATNIDNVIIIPTKMFKYIEIECVITSNPFYNMTLERGDTWILHMIPKNGAFMSKLNDDFNVPGVYSYVGDLKKSKQYTYNFNVKMFVESDHFYNEHKCITSNEFGHEESMFNITKEQG